MAAEVSPQALHGYLTGAGWRVAAEVNGGLLWSVVDGGDDFEVLLPTDSRLRDFRLRMFDVLRTLSVVENRPVEFIVADLDNQRLDTATFRLLPDGPPGTVPLLSGVDAVEGVRDLLLATTFAAVLPEPLVVQHRRPPQVQEFVRRVRLGVPRAGSWTVTVQLGAAIDTDQPAGLGGEPSTRQVSLQTYRTIKATLAAAAAASAEPTGGGSVEPFLSRVEEGVSANVCEALAKLGRGAAFEVRFGWALDMPPEVGGGVLRFDERAIEVIRQAAGRLRVGLPEGPVELVGAIQRLRRKPGQDGSVTLVGIVESREGVTETRVVIRLPSLWYDVAVDAHRRQRRVHIVGEARRGRVETIHSVRIVAES